MFVKIFALCLILGACVAIPVEDSKHPVPVPPPVGVPPYIQGLPPPTVLPPGVEPPKQDSSDLKTDASTYWRTYWHRSYPVYYYSYPSYTAYSYWY